MEAFVDRHGLTFDNVADESGAVWRQFGVTDQPAFVFIDAAGGERLVMGRIGEDALLDGAADLLG